MLGMIEKLPNFTNSAWQILKDTLRAYGEDRCSLWAAALAYYGLISIFPLILFLIFLGSEVFVAGNMREILNRFLAETLPIEVTNIIRIVNQTLESRGSIGLIGALGLLWSASAVFSILEAALNRIWNGRARPFWGRRLLASATILVLSLAFVATITLSPIISLLFTTLSLPGAEPLAGVLNLFMIVLTAYLLFRTFPNRRVPRLPALAGALFTTFLLVLARFLIEAYLDSAFTNYGAVYGSLAWVIYLALWAYIVGTLFLLGAEFGVTLHQHKVFARWNSRK